MRISRAPGATAAQLALTASFLVASYFVVFDAGDYLRNVTAAVYGRYWPVRDWMFLHIAAGALALVAGGVQMYLGLRRRTSTAHRWVGRIYVGAMLTSCSASLAVLRHGSVFGPTWVALLTVLSACALIFTACGWSAARRRDRPRHTAWMIRSYMAMMVFAWFRLAWELPLLRDAPLDARAATMLALTMLITFVGTELVLRRGRIARDPVNSKPTESAAIGASRRCRQVSRRSGKQAAGRQADSVGKQEADSDSNLI